MKTCFKFLVAGLFVALVFGCRPSAKVGELTGVNETPSFQDTDWEVASIREMAITPGSIMINFGSAGNQLSGLLPCNKMGGSYKLEGKHLTISLISTKMACDGKMKLESAFTEALHEVTSYAMDGRVVTLKGENGDVMKLRPYQKKTI